MRIAPHKTIEFWKTLRIKVISPLAIFLATQISAQEDILPSDYEVSTIDSSGNFENASSSVTRHSVDLIVPGSVGLYPLRVVRNGRNIGIWFAYLDNMSPLACLVLRKPDGGEARWWWSGSADYDTHIMAPCPVSGDEKIKMIFEYPNGSVRAIALLPDGGKVVFQPGGSHVIDYIEDPHGLRYTYEYENLSYYSTVPSKITDVSGRWLYFEWSGDNSTIPISVESSNGDRVFYTYSGTSVLRDPIRINYSDGTHGESKMMSRGLYDEPRLGSNIPCVNISKNKIHDDYYLRGSLMYYSGWQINAIEPTSGVIVSKRDAYDPGNDSYRETRGDGFSRTIRFTNIENYTYQFETYRRVERITDFMGNAFTYEYEQGMGLLTKTTDPLGRSTTLERHGPFGRTTKVTMPDGASEKWEYADNNTKPFVSAHTDANGNVTTYTRTQNNLISRVTYPDGTYETWEYNNFNQPTEHRLRNGAVECFVHDSMGRLIEHFEPDFGELFHGTRYTYYPEGHPWMDRVKTVTDPLGNTTTYEYDCIFINGIQTTTPAYGRGLVTKIINADATCKTFGYDPYGNKIWEENELQQRTTYSYDSYRRLKTQTDPLGNTTTYQYARLGTSQSEYAHTFNKPSIITSPTGRKEAFAYDGNFRLITHTIAYGTTEAATTTYAYDSVGNQISVADPMGRVTAFEYDNRNRKIAQHLPGGRTTRWEYDLNGNVTRIINPDNTVKTKTYDAMNRVLTETDEMGYTVSYEYNWGGQVFRITDRKGYKYRFQYDDMGRKTAFIYPQADGSEWGPMEEWSYNRMGKVQRHKNRSGQVLIYTYDNCHREIYRKWNHDDDFYVKTTYDATGKVTCKENAIGSVAYEYDTAGRLTLDSQTPGDMGYMDTFHDYNADGQRIRTFNEHQWIQATYAYNERGLLSAVSVHDYNNDRDHWISYAHNQAGQRIERAYSNNASDTYSYDNAGRLSGITTHNDQSPGILNQQDFAYDLRDRRIWSMRDNAYGDTYDYQADGQLTEFKTEVWRPDINTNHTGQINYNFNYDPNGNRIAHTENTKTTTYNANARNEYTGYSDGLITSDERGNVSWWFDGMGMDCDYVYDAENRLVAAIAIGWVEYRFEYDAEGRLAIVTRNGQKEYRHYDGHRLTGRWIAGQGWVEINTWGAGTTEIVASNAHFYHHDPMGSPIALTDMETGQITERYKYDAYGNVFIFNAAWESRLAMDSVNRWLFTGQEWFSDLDLYNFKNRFYHPALGRFMQQDPLRFEAGDLNLYRYCFNNPINLTDPFGLESIEYLHKHKQEEAISE
jgi:RHS repeat-associated protein